MFQSLINNSVIGRFQSVINNCAIGRFQSVIYIGELMVGFSQ